MCIIGHMGNLVPYLNNPQSRRSRGVSRLTRFATLVPASGATQRAIRGWKCSADANAQQVSHAVGDRHLPRECESELAGDAVRVVVGRVVEGQDFPPECLGSLFEQ